MTTINTATADENNHAWQNALREGPQQAARVAADWLHEIADRQSSGKPLDAFDDIWPLLLVEAKVAEVVRSVSPAARLEAETRFFGAPLQRQ
ncbi:hypothetical protein ACVILI_001887 [Mesorhizobium sp. USDA 4775]|uniref:hypothetical protein n=1 Tax=Mesorhizobium jarvisii TaxID=1777867 RepID=UPI001F0A6B82|nr:hypothetical protein [Mesorhizobium jarvisii]MCH4561283.1 hypothetical protein [Mesorhizobium jarvisii]